ncbi:MAG TPA: TatD family hydrolase, partial [Rhodocyclaceae bacterium]|nr:TatD family hydrolase [Rhodocyclaceae bacterium]
TAARRCWKPSSRPGSKRRSKPILVDTHCHLDAAEFDGDRETVAARALAAGVTTVVVPAVERANFGAVASVCRDHPGCRPAYGIHPMYVTRAREEDLEALRQLLQRESPVAIGETGLDFFIPDWDEALQEFYFVEQLKIARDLELPVILHVRRAVDAILKHLRRIRVPGGIAHAFNGSRQQAEAFIGLGFKLGFGGAMTHPRATRIRELAATLPLESIVLETDAPDIPPAWLNGGRNEPGELPRIAEVLAELRRLPPAAIAEATTANADAVLHLQ